MKVTRKVHWRCLKQHGFSLTELMVAMALGLVLMGGVMLVFDNTKRAYKYQAGLSQVQEQGRFAISFLSSSLRVAGYPGDTPPGGNKIEGTDGIVDTVTVRLMKDFDCRDQATGGIAVNRFRIDGDNLECSGDGVNWDVYVENIEDMQMLYGEDTDDDGIANRYVQADQDPEWSNVVAARVALLLRSSDNAAYTPEDYVNLAGITVTPDDQRLRRTFSTTIALRN